MAKNKKKADKWVVKFNYSVYENLLNGDSLTLTLNEEKNQIIVNEIKRE